MNLRPSLIVPPLNHALSPNGPARIAFATGASAANRYFAYFFFFFFYAFTAAGGMSM